MDAQTKLNLINKIIAEYWEYNEKEQIINGAPAIITAISTVVDFEED